MALAINELQSEVWPCAIDVRRRTGNVKFDFFVREPSAEEAFDDFDRMGQIRERGKEGGATDNAINRDLAKFLAERYMASDESGTALTKEELAAVMKMPLRSLLDLSKKIQEATGLAGETKDEAKNS